MFALTSMFLALSSHPKKPVFKNACTFPNTHHYQIPLRAHPFHPGSTSSWPHLHSQPFLHQQRPFCFSNERDSKGPASGQLLNESLDSLKPGCRLSALLCVCCVSVFPAAAFLFSIGHSFFHTTLGLAPSWLDQQSCGDRHTSLGVQQPWVPGLPFKAKASSQAVTTCHRRSQPEPCHLWCVHMFLGS